MTLGLYLRNMGPQSTVDTLVECTRGAEAAGIDDLWARAFAAVGVTRLIHASRYADVTAFVSTADLLTQAVRPALPA